MTAEANLPHLFGPWMRAVTRGPIAAETNATCDHCAMLPSPGSPPDVTYFHPATKCCAYQPHLPNFLAGMILADTDPAMAPGRAELQDRIAKRVVVTPGWAGPGNIFGLLYKSSPRMFGRAAELRCQFLSPTGGCGIWKYRPAVCVTWFCKYTRGNKGFQFWRLADKLLQMVEQELAVWCLAEMKMGAGELEEPSAPHPSELGGEIDWRHYRTLWGAWAGREAEFYRACARMVEGLPWEQVLQICGPRLRILAEMVRDAYAGLESDAIPSRVRVGRVQFVGAEHGGFRVVSYSGYDPLHMPEKLARVLPYFDGRPTEEALEAILTKEGVRVQLELVRRMLDFGVLESCDLESKALPVLG